MGQKQRLLLIDDVESLGRQGEVVEVKNGFARNFLLPQGKATFATKHTLRMQTRLQGERAKQAIEDKAQAELLKVKIDKVPSIILDVNVDPEGNLYGSVSVKDIAEKLKENDLDLDQKYFQLAKPIRETGKYNVPVLLKEGIESKITVIVKGENQIIREVVEEVAEEKATEEIAEEEKTEEES